MIRMNRCGKCTLPVYFAESVQAIGKFFHRHCFICSNVDCARGLDSRNCSDHAGKPYCTHCHRLLFGPKGVGYGVGAGILSSGNPTSEFRFPCGQDKSNPVTSSISYGVTRSNEQPIFRAGIAEKPVAFCEIKPTIAEQFYVPAIVQSAPSTKYASPLLDEQPRVRPFSFSQTQKKLTCGKCSKTVYEAEKIIAAGTVWHKNTCFVCTSCNKRLESRTMCERQGELYCNRQVSDCYARAFGPKGYGHGIGAGILQLHQ